MHIGSDGSDGRIGAWQTVVTEPKFGSIDRNRITEFEDATKSSSLVLEHGLDQLHWLVSV